MLAIALFLRTPCSPMISRVTDDQPSHDVEKQYICSLLNMFLFSAYNANTLILKGDEREVFSWPTNLNKQQTRTRSILWLKL
jgi:hypothetical protein